MSYKQKGILFFCILILFCKSSIAQFTSATLGIDGLTCSACSYGTEISIRKLDFVDSVKMELNKNIAEITFKKDKNISIEALVKKVYDAGFSVRFVQAVYHFDQPVAINDHVLKSGSSTFYFLKADVTTLTGDVNLNFIKEKYVPKKELAKWKAEIAKAQEQLKSYAPPFYYVTIL